MALYLSLHCLTMSNEKETRPLWVKMDNRCMTAELLICMFSFTNTMHDIYAINDLQLHDSFMYSLTISMLGNC